MPRIRTLSWIAVDKDGKYAPWSLESSRTACIDALTTWSKRQFIDGGRSWRCLKVRLVPANRRRRPPRTAADRRQPEPASPRGPRRIPLTGQEAFTRAKGGV